MRGRWDGCSHEVYGCSSFGKLKREKREKRGGERRGRGGGEREERGEEGRGEGEGDRKERRERKGEEGRVSHQYNA